MWISSLFFDVDCVSDVVAITQKLHECNNKKLNLNKDTQEEINS
jgi:hypothetical protein